MKFSLVNLGCKVNRVEADGIGSQLLAAGWLHVDEDADVAIVNTCTVTAEADRKTRKEVNRAAARNPRAVVLVTGCAAALDPASYEALSEQVRIVPKGEVVEACLALTGQDLVPAASALRIGGEFPTRVGIKVQDGCDNACTYCIVHVARGHAVSVPLGQCIEQVRAYARAGVREIVLSGIDLGAYHSDGVRLAGLVSALRKEAPEVRLRVSSIEPVTIDDDFIELLSLEDGMVCRHLHVPLQSGSSKVLHEMARRYSAQRYIEIVEKVRSAVGGLSLSTDCIVGFPGETEQDFAETMEVARACGFSRMHVFRYSRRAGTPAASRSDQVPDEVKAQRSQQLMKLAGELRLKDAATRIGQTERVLVESGKRGMSESYYPVNLQGRFERGELVECTLASFGKDGAFGL